MGIKSNVEPVENKLINDGMHILSAVDEVRIEDEYGEPIDGYAIVLDETTYLLIEDPDDGYRSYAYVRPLCQEEKVNVLNRFIPQEVCTRTFQVMTYDDYDTVRNSIFQINNPHNGSVILEASTYWPDQYYPCGRVEYHPENLPANTGKR